MGVGVPNIKMNTIFKYSTGLIQAVAFLSSLCIIFQHMNHTTSLQIRSTVAPIWPFPICKNIFNSDPYRTIELVSCVNVREAKGQHISDKNNMTQFLLLQGLLLNALSRFLVEYYPTLLLVTFDKYYCDSF